MIKITRKTSIDQKNSLDEFLKNFFSSPESAALPEPRHILQKVRLSSLGIKNPKYSLSLFELDASITRPVFSINSGNKAQLREDLLEELEAFFGEDIFLKGEPEVIKEKVFSKINSKIDFEKKEEVINRNKTYPVQKKSIFDFFKKIMKKTVGQGSTRIVKENGYNNFLKCDTIEKIMEDREGQDTSDEEMNKNEYNSYLELKKYGLEDLVARIDEKAFEEKGLLIMEKLIPLSDSEKNIESIRKRVTNNKWNNSILLLADPEEEGEFDFWKGKEMGLYYNFELLSKSEKRNLHPNLKKLIGLIPKNNKLETMTTDIETENWGIDKLGNLRLLDFPS